MRASILCHYAGQSAAVALCMYQALFLKRLAVQWPVCAVDQEQDLARG